MSFKLQKNYWDQRYASGGSSGTHARTWLKNPFNFRYFFDPGCKEKNLITVFKGFKYPYRKNTDGVYQKYRPLSEYYDYFKEFELLNIIPYPNDIDGMYVFKRHEK